MTLEERVMEKITNGFPQMDNEDEFNRRLNEELHYMSPREMLGLISQVLEDDGIMPLIVAKAA